jgi:hypothetical protein
MKSRYFLAKKVRRRLSFDDPAHKGFRRAKMRTVRVNRGGVEASAGFYGKHVILSKACMELEMQSRCPLSIHPLCSEDVVAANCYNTYPCENLVLSVAPFCQPPNLSMPSPKVAIPRDEPLFVANALWGMQEIEIIREGYADPSAFRLTSKDVAPYLHTGLPGSLVYNLSGKVMGIIIHWVENEDILIGVPPSMFHSFVVDAHKKWRKAYPPKPKSPRKKCGIKRR